MGDYSSESTSTTRSSTVEPTPPPAEPLDGSGSSTAVPVDNGSGSGRRSPSIIRRRNVKLSLADELNIRKKSDLDVLESDVEEEQFGVQSDGLDFSGIPPDPEPHLRSPTTGGPKPEPNPLEYPGFFQFFWNELIRGYALENEEARYSEKRRKVYAFIKIPRELERFLWYGFIQCMDAFLYFFTFLPLRFIIASLKILLYPVIGQSVSPSEMCDFLKVNVLLAAVFMMHYIDTSFMYHLIRGQAVIKLYIFYNMLEVADKLFSSFGQDILDALFWTATEPGSRRGTGLIWTALHLIGAVFYVIIHTILVLLQATTLSVAFNSHNKALLTIMMSNNFVELKGSVFKKFAKSNLFQMACSDVRERFHYVVLLSIVIVRNMTAVNWEVDHFWEMCPDLAMVIGGEFCVDWLKHAFITKFNEIPYEVYRDFTTTIAYDVARSRQKNAFSDHSDQVSRRMGFIPLPLSVLLIRILSQSFKIQSRSGFALLALTYLALITLKVANSIVLLGKASAYIDEYESMQEQVKHLKRLSKKKASSVPGSPRLSLLDFNDIMGHAGHHSKGFFISDILQNAAEIAAVQQQEKDKEKLEMEAAKLSRSKSVAQLTPFKKQLEEERMRRQSGDLLTSGGTNSAEYTTPESPNSNNGSGGPFTASTTESGDLLSELLPASSVHSGMSTRRQSLLHIDTLAAGGNNNGVGGGGSSGVIVGVGGAGAVGEDEAASSAAPTSTPTQKRVKMESECESLANVNRYTLVNDERIEL